MKLLLNLSSIKKASKVIRSSLLQSKKSTVDSKKIFFRKTKVKKDAIRRKDTFLRNKKEYDRRKVQEAVIEAKEIVTNPIKVVGKSAGGFLSRILSFIGTLLLGWIVNNLPTIIAMAQEFIARAQRLYELFTGFISNVLSSVRNFGNVLSAVFQNIITLDFFDTSNRVKNSLDDLQKNFDDMGKQLDEGMRLVTTSLTEPIAPGGPGAIPETGTDYGMASTEEVEPSRLGPATDLNTGAKAFVDAGFPAKGAAYLAGNVQQESGWRGQRSPWVLDDGAGTNKGLMSWNRGRITNAEKYLGKPLNKASNAEQIRWIKYEMKTYYQSAYKVFMNPNATDAELQRASYTYLGYGDVGKRFAYAKEALKSLESSGVDIKAPGKVSASPSSGNIIPQGKTTQSSNLKAGDMVSGFSVTSPYGQRWGRLHGGVDIGTPVGTYLSLGVPTEIIFSGMSDDYGNVIDAWAPSLGLQFRMAHLQTLIAKKGQKLSAGEVLGRTGGAPGDKGAGSSTGPHVHFEVDNIKGSPRYGGMGNPSPYAKFLNLSSTKPTQGQSTSQQAQPSPPKSSTSSTSTSRSTSTSTTTTSTPTQSMVTGKSGYVGSTNVVSTGYKDASGRDIKLNPGAAQAFKQMIDAGMPFSSKEIANVYRDENEYLRLKSQGYKPASNSKHNLGMAADIHGAMNTWIRKNGAKYGWYVNDYSGSHGGHFEWRGGGSSVSPQTPATPSQPDIASGQQAETSTQRFPVISTTGRALNTVNAIQTPIDDSQQFIYIDDIQQQSPSQPSGGKSSGGMMPIIINNRNKFMKDMLLLDLAYT